MQLDAHATNQDIVSFIDDLCDTTNTSYTLEAKVRAINTGYEELVGRIIVADGTWQFDDTNYTDLPKGTGLLVEAQENYSFSSDYLSIEAIEILDTNNLYRRIKPLDHKELGGKSPREFFGATSSGGPAIGFPRYFDQVGDTITLYPAPTSTEVTLSAGLQVWFKRTVDLFTTSDTTQAPAFPSSYHSILAYIGAMPYCMKYKQERVGLYQKKIDEMTRDLLAFYGLREKARTKHMVSEPISFR